MKKLLLIFLILISGSGMTGAEQIFIQDDKEIKPAGEDAGDIEKEEEAGVYMVPGKGFHESMMRLCFVYGGYIINPWGEMMKKEDRLYDANKSDIPGVSISENENEKLDDVSYSERNIGLQADYMFPSIKYLQQMTFDLTGVKYGIRARYLYSRIEQYINFYPEDEDQLFKSSGEIADVKLCEAGPTVDIIFSPRSNSFNVILHAYALFGYVSGGNLSAAAALRDAGIPFNNQDRRTSFNGFSFSLGLGPHFALNRWAPVVVGVNLKYTHMKLFLDRSIGLYGDDKIVSLNSIGAELACGVHLF